MPRDARRKPYKFTLKKRTEYLELLRGGQRRGPAAHAVGVTRQTVSEYKKRDLEFADLADDAEMDANEEVEDALFMAATSGNVTAIQVWLYNRWPERWRDARNLNVVAAVKTEQIKTEMDELDSSDKREELFKTMLKLETILGDNGQSAR